MPSTSLTHDEARERAALIHVDSYVIRVDLTDMASGSDFNAVSTIRFGCTTPGATTFVDAAVEVREATLNGRPIDPAYIEDDRIRLPDLQAENELVVMSVQSDTAQGEHVHRMVDPTDHLVYVNTSFEPDDARRAWACFDQPDLKAPHQFIVVAPADWTVVSNSGDVSIEPHGESRRWTFPPTLPLSTYVPVLCAGPFYELRSERGGHDLGLLCRQSLKDFLDRDAEELFELTDQGLAFYGERFGLRFPQRKYDQVFVPDMGGAMENFGCVVWTDAVIFRTPPTYAERELRALILLHEMAHMWFGDMVTMKWWDDLWLNEAFAEWACHWAAERATRFTDVWTTFLAGDKLAGYGADMAPTTHPIRQPVGDVAAAAASFDGITYPKGAAALKQLFAYVGEDACVAGLRDYFAQFAWGNTELSDLMTCLAQASGRDLSAWTRGWLDTAGTDTLRLSLTDDGAVLHAGGPDGGEARPHRLGIGVYADRDGELERVALLDVETAGTTTRLDALPDAHLLLVNDDDLTFASCRPDPDSLRAMVDSAHRLPTAMARAVCVTTVWDMLKRGELSSADTVRCLTGVLAMETTPSVIDPYLQLAVGAADDYSPDHQRAAQLSAVADACLDLVQRSVAPVEALRTLAVCAVTEDHLRALTAGAGEDVDLRWRLLQRLAEDDRADPAEVAALKNADPDPDTWVRALAVDAARPDLAAKQAAWQAAVIDRTVPNGSMRFLYRALWNRSQGELAAPLAERFLQVLPTLHRHGMLPALSATHLAFPNSAVDASFVDRATAAANAPAVAPIVRAVTVERCDLLRRKLRSRTSHDG